MKKIKLAVLPLIATFSLSFTACNNPDPLILPTELGKVPISIIAKPDNGVDMGDLLESMHITYDDKNRIETISNKKNGITTLYDYSYTQDGHVSKIESFVEEVSTRTYNFTRTDNVITVLVKDEYDERADILTINPKNQLVSQEMLGFSDTFTYDNKDNITKWETRIDGEFEEALSFKFDNKKGIFSNVKTPSYALIYMFDYIFLGAVTTTNNVTELNLSYYDETGNEIILQQISSYDYDADDYPVKRSTKETNQDGVLADFPVQYLVTYNK